MIVVFTGPTLPADQARAILPDAVYLPPVAQGDVYRAAGHHPRAIALIDGFFEHVPAVWHKEILWAMAQGIHVFGSSSMGALRAAELALFGMEGVGAIYEQIVSGQIEDDDEVAVAHAGASDGFTPLSVALVDLRATFAAAEQQSVIDAAAHAALIEIAKSLYYPRRIYPTVISAGEAKGFALDALKAWLPSHAISQKRADAILLLETLKQRFAAPVEPKRVRYSFQTTQMWQMVTESAGSLALDGDQPQHYSRATSSTNSGCPHVWRKPSTPRKPAPATSRRRWRVTNCSTRASTTPD